MNLGLDFARDPEDILEKFRRFDATVDMSMIRRILMAISVSDHEGAKAYKDYLNKLYAMCVNQKAASDLTYMGLPDASDGYLKLGRAFQGTTLGPEVSVKLENTIHTVIIGKTGSGKTVLLYHFCREIDDYNATVDEQRRVWRIAFDRRKDFRNITDNQVVLSAKEIPLSLEPPPGCDFVEWLADIGQLLMSIWQVRVAGRNRFIQFGYALFISKTRPSSLVELRDAMKDAYETGKRLSERSIEGFEVIIERLDHMIRELGKALSYHKTLPLDQFIDGKIPLVIEADVSDDNYAFVVGYFQRWIYRYNKAHDIRGNVGKNGGTVMIFDEAGRLFDPAKAYGETRRENGIDAITASPTELRDFSVMLVCASQRPLAPEVMSSANLKIFGNVGDWDDMQYLANSMGDPELVEIIPRLKTGQFIFKYGNQRPALLQTDDFQISERIDDETLRQRMRPFIESIQAQCAEQEEPEEEGHVKLTLSVSGRRMLFDIYQYPDHKLADRYDRLGLENRKQQEVVREIEEAGYATVVPLVVNGKRSKYVVLTQKAITWFRSVGKNVDHLAHIGKQGPEHSLLQQLTITTLRKTGFNTWHDRYVPQDPESGKLVDVYAEGDGKRIAFEIAVSSDVDVRRVGQALKALDECVFLCKDLVIMQSVKQNLAGIDDSRIRFELATKYLFSLRKAGHSMENQENNANSQKGLQSDKNDGEKPEHGGST